MIQSCTQNKGDRRHPSPLEIYGVYTSLCLTHAAAGASILQLLAQVPSGLNSDKAKGVCASGLWRKIQPPIQHCGNRTSPSLSGGSRTTERPSRQQRREISRLYDHFCFHVTKIFGRKDSEMSSSRTSLTSPELSPYRPNLRCVYRSSLNSYPPAVNL